MSLDPFTPDWRVSQQNAELDQLRSREPDLALLAPECMIPLAGASEMFEVFKDALIEAWTKNRTMFDDSAFDLPGHLDPWAFYFARQLAYGAHYDAVAKAGWHGLQNAIIKKAREQCFENGHSYVDELTEEGRLFSNCTVCGHFTRKLKVK